MLEIEVESDVVVEEMIPLVVKVESVDELGPIDVSFESVSVGSELRVAPV